MSYQAITTKYLGPSNVRPSRVKATTESGISITLSWDHALDSEENHRAAAIALIKKMKWNPVTIHGGGTKTGYVWVMTDRYGKKDEGYKINPRKRGRKTKRGRGRARKNPKQKTYRKFSRRAMRSSIKRQMKKSGLKSPRNILQAATRTRPKAIKRNTRRKIRRNPVRTYLLKFVHRNGKIWYLDPSGRLTDSSRKALRFVSEKTALQKARALRSSLARMNFVRAHTIVD